jgi:hypothetical protein
VIHQGHDRSGIWGELLPEPENQPATPTKIKGPKKVWKVKEVPPSNSVSPGPDAPSTKQITLEKSRARQN